MNVGTQDVGLSISAAGTTQATATQLINGMNQVSTVASGAGVVLFLAPTGGYSQLVYNGGANSLKVYPPLAAKINALGANNAMTLAPGTSCLFWYLSATLIGAILSA